MSMPRVEWAVLCDLAYFDAGRNLCMIGMQTQAVPAFSPGARRFAIAAHVPGLRPDPSVSVSLSTPDEAPTARVDCEHVQIEAVGDHLVLNIGVAPLVDHGIYRFEVSLGSRPALSLDLPIVIAGTPQIPGAPPSPGGMNHVGLG
jgi:hypothetical protein